ncbi:hypothetical protein ACB098_12G122700 [Castanea mollissima]
MALILSITSWEIKGWPSMTSLLWADQIIQPAKGKVVILGMCGRPGVMEEEVHKLEPIGEVRCKEPKREGVVHEVILDRKDNREIMEDMNGGFQVRVTKGAGVIIEDVSSNKVRFSGEVVVAG